MKRDQALATLIAERERLQREYGVKSMALFGSVARDEATAASDLDLGNQKRSIPDNFKASRCCSSR